MDELCIFHLSCWQSETSLEAQETGIQLTADTYEATVPNFMENIKTSDIIIWIVF
jgi:hypothetical protein